MKPQIGLVRSVVLGMVLGTVLGMSLQAATAAEIKVLTTGAFKQVVVALVPEFEKATGHKVVVDNGTVGQLTKRVDGGETFDVLVLNPRGIENYIKQGKIVAGSNANLAKVGVGVMVKAGAPKPDIGSVEAFKQALLNAKSVGYIDPASGGSSGIYVAGLLDKLGIADADQAQGQAAAGRPRVRPGGERAGRDWHPPDERDRLGEGRDPGRAVAGGDPELHHLRGRTCRRRPQRRGRQGLHRAADRARGRGRAEIPRHGAGLTPQNESARLGAGAVEVRLRAAQQRSEASQAARWMSPRLMPISDNSRSSSWLSSRTLWL